MAKRNPNKTAKNKMIAKMTEELEKLLPYVLDETGITPMRDYLSSFICEKIVKKLIISER